MRRYLSNCFEFCSYRGFHTKGDFFRYGTSFGSALAIAISFTTHKSILWAIIHGFFSWFYVIYFALTQR